MSIPSGKGARSVQLPPEQKNSPRELVVLNVNCTPLRVMVKLIAPSGASPGAKGSSVASLKAGSVVSKIKRA
ncbi:MAG: hypothetical protein AABN95_06130 [Acidobacteriota bacterium]